MKLATNLSPVSNLHNGDKNLCLIVSLLSEPGFPEVRQFRILYRRIAAGAVGPVAFRFAAG
jgi:hypothetical protein